MGRVRVNFVVTVVHTDVIGNSYTWGNDGVYYGVNDVSDKYMGRAGVSVVLTVVQMSLVIAIIELIMVLIRMVVMLAVMVLILVKTIMMIIVISHYLQ